jgi:hypothetical protein
LKNNDDDDVQYNINNFRAIGIMSIRMRQFQQGNFNTP